MVHLLFGPGSVPFAVALGVVLGIGLIEVILLLLGGSVLGLDSGSPELEAPALEASAVQGPGTDTAVETADGSNGVTHWLQVGDLPGLMLLVLGLTGYGLTGMVIQIFANGGLSPWLVSIPAVVGAVAAVRFIGGPIQRLLRKGDGKVISLDEMIGHEATIVLGTTRPGLPTQAKLKDLSGHTHYVLVEPLREQDQFETGAVVLLAQRVGPKFLVVSDTAHLFESLPQDSPSDIRGRV